MVAPDAQTAPAVHHTDWRKVIHAEFSATLAPPTDPAVPSEVGPESLATSETPVDPDTLVLSKFVVRGPAPNFRELEKDLRAQRMNVENVAMKKLGIGQHEAKFRHFSMGCYTIFFIPVVVGISW